MPSLRENLKDHPIQSILTGLASLATILGFIFILRSESCSNKKQNVYNDKQKEDTSIIVNSSENQGGSSEINKPNTVNKKDTIRAETIKQPIQEEVKTKEEYNINNCTYCSFTMGCNYFIKFYDYDGKSYKFIAYESAYNFHGKAFLKKTNIKLITQYGTNEVCLSNQGQYLTGSISNEDGREFSLNYKLSSTE